MDDLGRFCYQNAKCSDAGKRGQGNLSVTTPKCREPSAPRPIGWHQRASAGTTVLAGIRDTRGRIGFVSLANGSLMYRSWRTFTTPKNIWSGAGVRVPSRNVGGSSFTAMARSLGRMAKTSRRSRFRTGPFCHGVLRNRSSRFRICPLSSNSSVGKSRASAADKGRLRAGRLARALIAVRRFTDASSEGVETEKITTGSVHQIETITTTCTAQRGTRRKNGTTGWKRRASGSNPG